MSIKEIESEIQRRKITRLCHFVHTNKLLHILKSDEGIKAVDFIDLDILEQNDNKRLDGKTDYINCSIQYPNYWYLRRVKDNNPIFNDWAILFIDPVVISLETTMFSPVNAAARFGAYIDKGYKAFNCMFDKTITSNNRTTNRTPQMLDNASTDDQAEVLVYRNIPRKFITGIALESEEIARNKMTAWNLIGVPEIDIYVAPDLFSGETSKMIRQGIAPNECKIKEDSL